MCAGRVAPAVSSASAGDAGVQDSERRRCWPAVGGAEARRRRPRAWSMPLPSQALVEVGRGAASSASPTWPNGPLATNAVRSAPQQLSPRRRRFQGASGRRPPAAARSRRAESTCSEARRAAVGAGVATLRLGRSQLKTGRVRSSFGRRAQYPDCRQRQVEPLSTGAACRRVRSPDMCDDERHVRQQPLCLVVHAMRYHSAGPCRSTRNSPTGTRRRPGYSGRASHGQGRGTVRGLDEQPPDERLTCRSRSRRRPAPAAVVRTQPLELARTGRSRVIDRQLPGPDEPGRALPRRCAAPPQRHRGEPAGTRAGRTSGPGARTCAPGTADGRAGWWVVAPRLAEPECTPRSCASSWHLRIASRRTVAGSRTPWVEPSSRPAIPRTATGWPSRGHNLAHGQRLGGQVAEHLHHRCAGRPQEHSAIPSRSRRNVSSPPAARAAAREGAASSSWPPFAQPVPQSRDRESGHRASGQRQAADIPGEEHCGGQDGDPDDGPAVASAGGAGDGRRLRVTASRSAATFRHGHANAPLQVVRQPRHGLRRGRVDDLGVGTVRRTLPDDDPAIRHRPITRASARSGPRQAAGSGVRR